MRGSTRNLWAASSPASKRRWASTLDRFRHFPEYLGGRFSACARLRSSASSSGRAKATVDPSSVREFSEPFAVKVEPFALAVRSEVAAYFGAFVPFDPEPVKPVEDRLLEFRAAAVAGGVLDSKHVVSAGLPREQIVVQSRAGIADVQRLRWGWAPFGIGVWTSGTNWPDHRDEFG